jgi:hypothetical protein
LVASQLTVIFLAPKILSVGSADIDKELAMAKARLAAFDAKKNIDVLGKSAITAVLLSTRY